MSPTHTYTHFRLGECVYTLNVWQQATSTNLWCSHLAHDSRRLTFAIFDDVRQVSWIHESMTSSGFQRDLIQITRTWLAKSDSETNRCGEEARECACACPVLYNNNDTQHCVQNAVQNATTAIIIILIAPHALEASPFVARRLQRRCCRARCADIPSDPQSLEIFCHDRHTTQHTTQHARLLYSERLGFEYKVCDSKRERERVHKNLKA
jgi:hypothetical protein